MTPEGETGPDQQTDLGGDHRFNEDVFAHAREGTDQDIPPFLNGNQASINSSEPADSYVINGFILHCGNPLSCGLQRLKIFRLLYHFLF